MFPGVTAGSTGAVGVESLGGVGAWVLAEFEIGEGGVLGERGCTGGFTAAVPVDPVAWGTGGFAGVDWGG